MLRWLPLLAAFAVPALIVGRPVAGEGARDGERIARLEARVAALEARLAEPSAAAYGAAIGYWSQYLDAWLLALFNTSDQGPMQRQALVEAGALQRDAGDVRAFVDAVRALEPPGCYTATHDAVLYGAAFLERVERGNPQTQPDLILADALAARTFVFEVLRRFREARCAPLGSP